MCEERREISVKPATVNLVLYWLIEFEMIRGEEIALVKVRLELWDITVGPRLTAGRKIVPWRGAVLKDLLLAKKTRSLGNEQTRRETLAHFHLSLFLSCLW